MKRLAALFTCGLLICAIPTSAHAQRKGGTYRTVLVTDPPTLDPAQATDTTSAAITRQLFDGLLELDEKLRPVPALAERFTLSADGRTYTFHLRRGVRFHNGREVRAADVKYSFERAARGKRPWVFEKIAGAPAFIAGRAREIAGLRMVDDLTVRITLERPFGPFPMLMAYDAASVVPREEAEPLGREFASRPMGTGAFRFGSWRRDDQVILEAFPQHFRGAPYLERIVYRIIPEEATRFAEYRTGNLEQSDVPTGHCRAIQSDPALRKEFHFYPILGAYALRFNVTRPPFGNQKLRQAISWAIDRDAIANVIMEGCVTVARGILPPGMPGYHPNVPGYGYDPERAKRLLAEAGYPGGKGLPPITLHYNTLALHRRVAELVQAQLREVGVAIRLANLDWAAYLKLVDDGGAQFFRSGWIADYPDPENFLTILFHSRNWGAPGNTSRYKNPAVDTLLDEADPMPLGPARLRKYQEAEAIIMNDAPWVSLYFYSSRLLLKPYVRGQELSALDSAPEMHHAPLRKVWLDR